MSGSPYFELSGSLSSLFSGYLVFKMSGAFTGHLWAVFVGRLRGIYGFYGATLWFCVVFYDVLRYVMILHDTFLSSMVLYGTVRSFMVPNST